MPRPATVEAYLAALEPGLRATLGDILGAVREDFPRLEVRLAWNVPQVVRGKDYVAGLSAAKSHVSLSPWSPAVLASHRDQLGGLESTANLIRLPPRWMIDRPLIRSLIRARLAELGPARSGS